MSRLPEQRPNVDALGVACRDADATAPMPEASPWGARFGWPGWIRLSVAVPQHWRTTLEENAAAIRAALRPARGRRA